MGKGSVHSSKKGKAISGESESPTRRNALSEVWWRWQGVGWKHPIGRRERDVKNGESFQMKGKPV